AVHHANEHRAHVCSILGAHGLPHPDIDGWAFGRAQGAFAGGGPTGEEATGGAPQDAPSPPPGATR
ncbi:MAG TPA: hypothetical protein VLW53_02875, partial [Candidatus Eisenbacteria bacterium]|nr:hypothetical protein [Candidatus Eisenbacteria bacterium]